MTPRFTLKALMLLVTLIALGLGFFLWQQRIVDERRAMLAEVLRQDGGYYAVMNTSTYEWTGNVPFTGFDEGVLQISSAADPWLLRRWLGDAPIRIIWFPDEMTPPDLAEKIPVLFPEVQIIRQDKREGPRRPHGVRPENAPGKPGR
jgi:hypothetical protein